jgi:5-methylcytosine-specific restriction protein A
MPGKPRSFRPAHLPSAKEAVREYERDRGSARQRGYTAAWDVASKAFRADPDHVLCLGCNAVKRVEIATVTDHIVPHRGDMDLFWDRSNWQGACTP